MIVGSHVHYNGEGLLGCVKEALIYGGNTFMFYTGNPQNTFRSLIDENKVKEAHQLMKENNIDLNHIICHAPYIINLANKEKNWEFSINFLKGEIARCKLMGVKYIVLHPGNAVVGTKEDGLNNIIEALNIILEEEKKVTILIETMSGKGTECGVNLDELSYLFNNIKNKANLGFCLDTCHLNDSGIDLNYFDDYLKEFANKIGLSYLKCIHLNDSKNGIASHKDRHANLGYGTIGFKPLLNIYNNPLLKDVPKILETPYINDNPPYKEEIEMLRTGIYNPNLLP